MSKRNPELELMRFVFCLAIIVHHSYNFLTCRPGGEYATGFFFVLSGLFMQRQASKLAAEASPVFYKTFRFVWTRLKKIYPYFFFSVLIGTLAWGAMRIVIGPWWKELDRILPELFLLQMFARWQDYWWITGVSWFLGALFTAFVCLFPIGCVFAKCGAGWIFSLIAITSITAVLQTPLGFGEPWALWLGPLHKGLLLGVAGVSLGAALGAIYEFFGNKQCLRFVWIRWVLYVLALIVLFCKGPALAVWLLCAGGIFFSVWSGDKRRPALDKPWVYFLGQWSVTLYLNHFYWAVGLGYKFSFFSLPVKWGLYIGLTVGSSLFVWWLVRRLMPYLIQQIVYLVCNKRGRAS